ncbi:MAG: hydrolase, partial [candidate division KSB1 bacterium]|nr:hydrolase [candidate division KSB1 bacterium]
KELNFSSWFHTHPKWHGNIWGGYYRTYNFAREYLAYYWQVSGELEWQALNSLELGTSANVFVEGKPNGQVQDVFLNARPYFSITPVNNLSLRAYLDDLFVRSTDRTVQTIFGLLFSYNFSPKSWIYFAVNETRSREPQFDALGHLIANRLRVQDRDGVFKLKYLYYF